MYRKRYAAYPKRHLVKKAHAYSDKVNHEVLTSIVERVREQWDEHYPMNVNVEVLLSNKRKLSSTTIKQLKNHPELENHYPTAFTLTLKAGRIRATISIEDNLSFGHKIKILVLPEASDEARELLLALQDWTEKFKQPLHINVWAQIPKLFLWFGALFFCWIGIAIYYGVVLKSDATYRAHQILDHGVTNENLTEAIATLLALESDYHASSTHRVAGPLFWFVLGTLAIAILLLSWRPAHPVIALGKGRNSLKRWNLCTRLIFTVIPFFIAADIVLPLLQTSLAKWFGLS